MKAGCTKYEEFVLPMMDKIKGWLKVGITEREIAIRVGVSWTSWLEYKREHPDFKAILNEARLDIDYKVENALLQRATGFTTTETRIITDDEGNVRETQIITKTIPPDVMACIFWLKNRQPGEWKDKIENGAGGALHYKIILPEVVSPPPPRQISGPNNGDVIDVSPDPEPKSDVAEPDVEELLDAQA